MMAADASWPDAAVVIVGLVVIAFIMWRML